MSKDKQKGKDSRFMIKKSDSDIVNKKQMHKGVNLPNNEKELYNVCNETNRRVINFIKVPQENFINLY